MDSTTHEVIESVRVMIRDTDSQNYRISDYEMAYFLKESVDEVNSSVPIGDTVTIAVSGPTINPYGGTHREYALSLYKIQMVILIKEALLNESLYDGANVSVGDIKIDVGGIIRSRRDDINKLRDKFNKLLYDVKINLLGGYSIDTFVTGFLDNTTDADFVVFE